MTERRASSVLASIRSSHKHQQGAAKTPGLLFSTVTTATPQIGNSNRVTVNLPRREFLGRVAGAAVLAGTSCLAQAQVSARPQQHVRVATGLLATWQSTAWLGAEAGLFEKRAIEMTFPAIAVGGPEAAAGLVRGDWEFAHTGTVPVGEEVPQGPRCSHHCAADIGLSHVLCHDQEKRSLNWHSWMVRKSEC